MMGNIRPKLVQHAARRALERIDQDRNRVLRRIFDQKMHMVGLAIAGEHRARHLLAKLGEMRLEPIKRRSVQHFTSIFCDADQMDCET